MMIKKQYLKLFFIFLSMAFLSHANAVCKKDGGKLFTSGSNPGNPVENLGEGFRDSCSDVPDFYQIAFYRMSLSSENPDPVGAAQPDYSSCQDMLTDTGVATTLEISGTSQSTLSVPDFTITPGRYGYMIARLSARLGIKHAFEATTKVVSFRAPGVARAAGSYCWTMNKFITGVDNPTPDIITPFGTTVNAGATDQSTFDCSDTENDMSNAEYAYEIVYVNADAGCGAFDIADGDRTTFGNVGNGIATSRMMQNATTSATACGNVDSILWTIALDEPYTVTTESNFQLNFKTTDSISIDFDGGAGRPTLIKAGANPIQANLTVSEPPAPE